MRYLLATAVFLAAATFPFALKGQSVVLASGSSAAGTWVQPQPYPQRPSGFRNFGGTRTVVFPPFFGYPPNYPFTYFYPSLWPPLEEQYQQAYRIAHGNVEAEVAAQQKEYLAGQVRALTEQVQSLRERQSYRQYPQEPAPSRPPRLHQQAPAAQSGAEQKFPATVFVYHDGREMEVRDYAIFGETLWIFNGQTARKFPLADFNLAASRQVNEEHGVGFPLSNPH